MGVNLPSALDSPRVDEPLKIDADMSGPVPDTIAVPRATKAYTGLHDALHDMSYEDMYGAIAGGREQDLRNQAASTIDASNASQSRQTAMQMLAGGNVNTPEDIGKFMQATSYENVDPKTVIEQGYGKAVMDKLQLSQQMMGGNVGSAFQTFPSIMQNWSGYGADMIAKQTYLQHLYEDNHEEITNQSWTSWGWNTLKSLLPGYNDYAIRSVDKAGALEGGPGLGSHLDVVSRHYWSRDFKTFTQLTDDTYNKLKDKDPEVAKKFLEGMMGQSTSDIIGANLGSGLDAVNLAGAVAGSKTAVRMINALKAGRQAVKDGAMEAMKPGSTPGSIANAMGDAETSANHTMASQMIMEAKGTEDMTKSMVDQLTSNFKSFDEQMRQNAGRFGQENVNRFIERRQQLEQSFLDTYGAMMKVDRMPELDTEKGLQAFKENFKNQFKTISDSVMDSKMYYEPLTNTRWGELQIGTPDGKFFTSPEGMINFAKEHGFPVRPSSKIEQDLEQRIKDLEQDLANPPLMEDDVHGLNLYDKKNQEYQRLLSERQSYKFTDHGDVFRMGEQGGGYYLSLIKPIDETQAWVRNLMGLSEFHKIFNPKSWTKTQLGRIRTSEELLSNAENQERKVATHGPTKLTSMFAEASDAIDKVAGKDWDQFKQVLEYGRKALDADGQPGYWFKHPGELDDFYVHNFHRSATPEETQAYFSYVRNYELKRYVENTNLYRFKARLGMEQHRLSFTTGGNKTQTPYFDGAALDHWPGANSDIVAMIDPKGKVSLARADNAWKNKDYNPWRTKFEKGEVKVIKLFDMDARPLKGFNGIGDERIRYVVSANSESKPLDLLNQVPRREGGHYVYDYDHYLKQANIHVDKVSNRTTFTYTGDNTIAGIPIRAIGKTMEKNFNDVRQLLKDKRLKEAEALHNQVMPGDLPFKDFQGWFDPTRDAKGKIVSGPRASLDEPFVLVENGKNIYNSHKERMEQQYGLGKFVDGTSAGDAQLYRVQFTNQRDAKGLMAIHDTGTRNNPIYSYEPAAMVDPMQTYNRATAQLVKSTFMDDYKINAYQHWLNEGLKYNLFNEPRDKVMGSYFHSFHNPPWRANLSAEEQLVKQNLMNAYGRINDFTGLMSDVERQTFSLKQNMVDSIYGKLGPKVAMLTDKQLAGTRDPTAFVRNITYHAFLGLFHIPSFFTQLSTALNVHAISPRSAMASTAAALMHNWTRINSNPEILDALDNKISKLSSMLVGQRGFRPGEFKEAFNFIKNQTGFDLLGHEQALLDDPTGAKVLRGIKDKVLDWGSIPFQEGARWTRIAAGYSAYLERREAIGPGTFTRQDWAWTLDRAADLDHNMSRASNSALHTGWASLAGQFQTYALRLNELMTGKRLTPMEKIRLFTMSSIAYGIPGGGISLYLFPLGDSARQSIGTGEGFGPGGVVPNPFPRYNPGESPLSTALMEGAPSALLQYLTSDGKDFRTGMQLDIRKWGPEQYQMLENAWAGEGVMKTLMGPAAGELANIWAGTSAVRQWVVSAMDPHSPHFPLTTADILEPLKNATATGSQFSKTMTALHTGRMLSNRGTYLDDVSQGEALSYGMFGLMNSRVRDTTNKEAVLKWRETYDKETLRLAGQSVQHALAAEADGDNDAKTTYFTQARAYFQARGYPEEKVASGLAQLIRDYVSLPNRLDYALNVTKERPGKKDEGLENMRRIYQMDQIRKEGRKK